MTDVIDASMMQIGNRLRHFRLLKGLTQTQFADEFGIDSKYSFGSRKLSSVFSTGHTYSRVQILRNYPKWLDTTALGRWRPAHEKQVVAEYYRISWTTKQQGAQHIASRHCIIHRV